MKKENIANYTSYRSDFLTFSVNVPFKFYKSPEQIGNQNSDTGKQNILRENEFVTHSILWVQTFSKGHTT